MNLTHTLVSSIFLETHSEIGSLTNDFNQLKTLYQTEKDYEIKMKEILEANEPVSESADHIENEEMSYFNNQVLTPLQIKKFQKILFQNTIKKKNDEQEINEKLTVILDQQEKEAFIHKLRTLVCCKTKTCLTKIDHESAFENFDNIRKLTKFEYNMFLLGMLHAIVHPKETLRGKEKQYLTVRYTFDGDEISICQHYHINSIKPIKHALLERKSHNALSFTTVLNALIFIVNYANCHELPSLEDTMVITFLSTSESYAVLFRIYKSNLDDDSDYQNERDNKIQEWSSHIE
ncbi:7738_t:CDS:2 [Scutellospora calospora]|uniref:7738_t:CDS:1 n=1 Tax=Scutellospora calospora TaxID=85575 RepID=A0ACA9JVF7_9GLOM|nr:7738_t:CDS:2 [Scutellospora calospora]